MHIALGRSYRGHRVRQGPVVYLALEGGLDFAPALRHGGSDTSATIRGMSHFLCCRFPSTSSPTKTNLSRPFARRCETPAVVVIDTLNRSLNGNENDSKDMAAYIRAADAIRETFHCAVMIVHHCGIAGNRPRGHTSLSGADDAQIAVERNDRTGIITARVEHMKDSEAGASVLSRLESVDLGSDDDGDPITSCVIVPVEGEQRSDIQREISGAAKIALDVLVDTLADTGERAMASNHIPAGVMTCSVDLWRRNCYAGTIAKTDDPDAKRQAFHRASTKLQERKIIGVWQDQVWLGVTCVTWRDIAVTCHG